MVYLYIHLVDFYGKMYVDIPYMDGMGFILGRTKKGPHVKLLIASAKRVLVRILLCQKGGILSRLQRVLSQV